MYKSICRFVVTLSCEPASHGHGGQRRSQQILELVRHVQPDPIIAPIGLNRDKGLFGKMFRYWRGWERNRKLFGCLRWGAGNSSCGAHELPKIDGNPGIWVIEDTRWAYAIPEAKRLGWFVVAVPQNLESLNKARERVLSPEKSARNLTDEIAALSHANAIFCISREEQHLLKCAGLQAGYLPYQPPKQSIPTLNSVRFRRSNMSKEFLLMVVNVHNSANKNGVLSFLSSMTQDVLLKMPPIILAGFGTDEFAGKRYLNKVQVAGTLNDAMLTDFQSRAIAMLVHQEYGTGCLTKIRDYFQAGIPVLANDTAARSYWGCRGLHVYRDVKHIPAILANGLDEPEIKMDDNIDVGQFLEKISQIVEGAN